MHTQTIVQFFVSKFSQCRLKVCVLQDLFYFESWPNQYVHTSHFCEPLNVNPYQKNEYSEIRHCQTVDTGNEKRHQSNYIPRKVSENLQKMEKQVIFMTQQVCNSLTQLNHNRLTWFFHTEPSLLSTFVSNLQGWEANHNPLKYKLLNKFFFGWL